MRKQTKRILSMLLSFVIVFGMIPASALSVRAWDEETDCDYCSRHIGDSWIADCGNHCSDEADGDCYENNHCRNCSACNTEDDAFCEDCCMCVECAIDDGEHCPECGACSPSDACISCGLCAECAYICDHCDRCIECADYDHCSECLIGCNDNEYLCDWCNRCELCVEMCETCDWNCIDCLIDNESHCRTCGGCFEEYEVCTLCYDACENCTEFCDLCGYCPSCQYEEYIHCVDCGACSYGDTWLCESCHIVCSECDSNFCENCCLCSACLGDGHCPSCGVCENDAELCGICNNCFGCGFTCSEGPDCGACLACHLEYGAACPDCHICFVSGGDAVYCQECNTCTECLGDDYCEECKLCVECAQNNECHCTECGDCLYDRGEGSYCVGCFKCFECADNCCTTCKLCGDCTEICTECNESCINCCAEICGNCGKCEKHVWLCPDCGEMCSDCGTVCGNCYSCENCEIICEECGEHCTNCYADICYTCGKCTEHVWLCPECGEMCSDCGTVCGNCYSCENCEEICEVCGEKCTSCAVVCTTCGVCENDGLICKECGETCDNCGVICGGCLICENCATVCPLCESYCSECSDVCGGCGVCESCAEVCVGCLAACQSCANLCVECSFCDACVDICSVCETYCAECKATCPDCGTCEECRELCPSCGMCEDCAVRCPDCDEVCSDCADLCSECALCENCTVICSECDTCENCTDICEYCGEYCMDCAADLGYHCIGCGEFCFNSGDPYCQNCELCADCADDFCEGCERCIECAVDEELHCPDCCECYGDAGECEGGCGYCVECCRCTRTVTFDANGGIGTMPEVKLYGALVLPECGFMPPVNSTFSGWKVNGVSHSVGDTVVVTEDTVITAAWRRTIGSATVYSISFDANGGLGTMDTVSVYGSKYVLPACQFTAPKNGRDVMVFAGWRVNDIQVVFPAGTPVDITGDTVLKAVWTKTTLTTYTVFFDANGGDGIYGPVYISAGTYTLPKCYFTAPAGKQFKAWEAGGVEYAPGNVITISSNTAVKAIWEDIYVVSFNANGGEGTMAPHTMTEGEYVLPECTFTPPAGMQFKTWKISTGEYAPGEKITVSDHVSVNAVWEAVPVTKTPITSVKVSDVTEPVIGAKPDYDVTLTGEGAALAEYDGEWKGVTWLKYNPEAGGWGTMDKDTPFEAGFYSLSVVLQPEEGYAFTYATEFYYNDDKLSEFGGSDDPCYNWRDEIVEIYLYFTLEDTATEKITSLSATVTVPVAGASPSFEAVVGGEGYTAELEWEIVAEETIIYPEDNYKFKAGEKYGLWLAFIPADGYGFADDVTITINGMIPEGMYKLEGNMICLVTYTIPAPAPITSVKVSGVTEPVFGAKPDFDITLTGDGVTFDAEEGIGYAWLKVEAEAHHRELLDEDTPFGEGLYALYVYLKPEAGYEFTDATKFCYGEKELAEYDGRDESCYDCYGDGADIYLYFTVEETVTLVDSSKKFTDVSATSWAKPGIDYVVTYGYMNGTGNGTTFSPSATMSRSMIVTVLYRIAGQPSHSGYNPFADITTGWYYDAVLWAYENGIVTGTSATTFAPDGAVTREQMATFLYRFAKYMGYDVTRTNDITTFPDADKVGSWAYDALAWANAEGLITGAKGSDGVTRLDPQGNATREQVATILMRFCKAFVE